MQDQNVEALVSIIIPVHDTASYLPTCLESILGQTWGNIEVICVDDGSTDGSLGILHRFAEDDRRMTVLTQDNLYAGAARNRGLARASGDFLLFLDSDDVFDSTMVERLVVNALANDADVVVCQSSFLDDLTGETHPIPHSLRYTGGQTLFTGDDLADILFQFCVGWAWDKLFRTSFIRGMGLEFQTVQSTNDAFFVYIALAQARRVSIEYSHLAYHRVNNKGSVSSSRESNWESACAAIEKIRDTLASSERYGVFRRSFVNWELHFAMWQFRTLTGHAQNQMACYIAGRIAPDVMPFLDVEGYLYDEQDDNRNLESIVRARRWLGPDDVATLSKPLPAGAEVPRLSVVVPFHDAEPQLADTVRTVLELGGDHIEVICVNDASTDRSLLEAKDIESEDDRVIVVNLPDVGVDAATEVGRRCCHGQDTLVVTPGDTIEEADFTAPSASRLKRFVKRILD